MNDKAQTIDIHPRFRKYDRPRSERLSGSEKRYILNYGYHLGLRAEKPVQRVLRGNLRRNPTALPPKIESLFERPTYDRLELRSVEGYSVAGFKS